MSPVKLSNNERKILINLLMCDLSELRELVFDGKKQLFSGVYVKDAINQREHIIEKLRNTSEYETH